MYITTNSIGSLHQLLLLPLENHNAIDSSSPSHFVLFTVSTAHHYLIHFFLLVEGDHFTCITFSLVEHHHPFQPFSASSSSPLSFQLTIFLSCCVCTCLARIGVIDSLTCAAAFLFYIASCHHHHHQHVQAFFLVEPLPWSHGLL